MVIGGCNMKEHEKNLRKNIGKKIKIARAKLDYT